MRNTLDAVAIGQRLRATREALGLTGTEFARGARLLQNAYSQYETGARLLTVSSAMRLCAAYGLTMDWLYRGEISTLPHSLAQKITNLHGNPGPQIRPARSTSPPQSRSVIL